VIKKHQKRKEDETMEKMNRQEELAVIKQKIKIKDLVHQAGLQTWPCGPTRVKIKSLVNVTERKPSLVIYLDQNSFYDFSAQEGGSVIDFYQLLYGVDYITAVQDLRDLASLNSSAKAPHRKPQDVLRAREAFNKYLNMAFLLASKERGLALAKLASTMEALLVDLQSQLTTTINEEKERGQNQEA